MYYESVPKTYESVPTCYESVPKNLWICPWELWIRHQKAMNLSPETYESVPRNLWIRPQKPMNPSPNLLIIIWLSTSYKALYTNILSILLYK